MSAPPEPTAAGTDRTRLARVVLQSALAVDGVLAPDPGPHGMHVTGDGPALLRGVRVVAEPGDRYSVDLGLQARLEPLPALAERVRERVARSAELAGLGDRLGAVSVTFHDVVDPDEAAAAALAEALP